MSHRAESQDNCKSWGSSKHSPLEHLSMSSEDWSQAATLPWLTQVRGVAAVVCTVDCLRIDMHCNGKETQPCRISNKKRVSMSAPWTVCLYLLDGGGVRHARRVGVPSERIADDLLIRGNLLLPIDPMVTQHGHPIIKMLLFIKLKDTDTWTLMLAFGG